MRGPLWSRGVGHVYERQPPSIHWTEPLSAAIRFQSHSENPKNNFKQKNRKLKKIGYRAEGASFPIAADTIGQDLLL